MSVSAASNNRPAPRVEYKPPPPPAPEVKKTETAQTEPRKSEAQKERDTDKFEGSTKTAQGTQPVSASSETQPSGEDEQVRELGGTGSGGQVVAASAAGGAAEDKNPGLTAKDKKSAEEVVPQQPYQDRSFLYDQNGEENGQPIAGYQPETREGYGQEKQDMWDAAVNNPNVEITPDEAAIMVAEYQQEGGRDTKKDQAPYTPQEKNYGPLNLNGDMLDKHTSITADEREKMNATVDGTPGGKPTKEALELTAKAAHEAMQDMGVNRYLHHVRGGQTGYDNPTGKPESDDPRIKENDAICFERTVANNALKVLEESRAHGGQLDVNNNVRNAGNIPWIGRKEG